MTGTKLQENANTGNGINTLSCTLSENGAWKRYSKKELTTDDEKLKLTGTCL